MLRVALVIGCMVLTLAGCATMSGVQQSCNSNFGVLDAKEVNCSGSVESISGSPSLNVVDIGDRVDGTFRLEVTMEVGQGTARAHVTDINDAQVGGKVAPDEPLHISALVYPEESGDAEDDDEGVDVHLQLAEGEEVRNLSYEAILVEQN